MRIVGCRVCKWDHERVEVADTGGRGVSNGGFFFLWLVGGVTFCKWDHENGEDEACRTAFLFSLVGGWCDPSEVGYIN